jgi:thioredoxin-like negative regulator of GroEL
MIKNIKDFNAFINEKDAVLVYFSTKNCNVCKVLKPKIKEMLIDKFPKIEFLYIDSEEIPEIPAQLSIFAAPTLIIFLDGKEFLRKSRNIGLTELENEIIRPYKLFFS